MNPRQQDLDAVYRDICAGKIDRPKTQETPMYGEGNYFDRVDSLEPRLGDAIEAICVLQERVRTLEERMTWLVEQLSRAQERD